MQINKKGQQHQYEKIIQTRNSRKFKFHLRLIPRLDLHKHYIELSLQLRHVVPQNTLRDLSKASITTLLVCSTIPGERVHQGPSHRFLFHRCCDGNVKCVMLEYGDTRPARMAEVETRKL